MWNETRIIGDSTGGGHAQDVHQGSSVASSSINSSGTLGQSQQAGHPRQSSSFNTPSLLATKATVPSAFASKFSTYNSVPMITKEKPAITREVSLGTDHALQRKGIVIGQYPALPPRPNGIASAPLQRKMGGVMYPNVARKVTVSSEEDVIPPRTFTTTSTEVLASVPGQSPHIHLQSWASSGYNGFSSVDIGQKIIALERQKEQLELCKRRLTQQHQQQQQSCQEDLLPHKKKPKQILAFLVSLPLKYRSQFTYVAVHLKRAEQSKPWGISFSKFGEKIIIGDVLGSIKAVTSWMNFVRGDQHHLDPSILYCPRTVTDSSAEMYARCLKGYMDPLSSKDARPEQLYPGDLIAAIDGHCPSTFRSLGGITDYLRKALNVTILIIRNPRSATVAMSYTNPKYTEMRLPDAGYQGANAANRVWEHVLWEAHVSLGKKQDIKFSYSKSQKKASRKKRAPANSTRWVPETWRNPWFHVNENPIPYDDNWEFSPEEGSRSKLFLQPINDFGSWLQQRKRSWRGRYKVYKHIGEDSDSSEDAPQTVSSDFWTPQGLSSFDEWLSRSLATWKLSYSWNKRKRKRILQECEEVVHVSQTSMGEFQHWLQVRRNQWRVLRRKRQRQKELLQAEESSNLPESPIESVSNPAFSAQYHHGIRRRETESVIKRRRLLLSPTSNDIACIDDILEEEERQKKALKNRPPIDIMFLFDGAKGVPDDVVVHCFEFLHWREHAQLFSINKRTSEVLQAREQVWRQLCPQHWILPRRPRKPWHELYFSKLRIEQRDHQKRWDDLLLKCYSTLTKGDLLQKIDKLVRKGEADFGFDVNYVSPVVCERNSILNLAVINQRHKVVRWLVDVKGANIESFDRGQFTPLMNAAWAGDRQLVRYFLQRGCDRNKIGTGHSSRALAHPDFKGLDAEGWARKRGHDGIADLIRLGL